jgi:hypothetical protein
VNPAYVIFGGTENFNYYYVSLCQNVSVDFAPLRGLKPTTSWRVPRRVKIKAGDPAAAGLTAVIQVKYFED